jgi:hypothetical protein
LHDDYTDDGRAIAQILDGWALPWTIRGDRRAYNDLAGALKQLDAPFGQFGLDTLNADTSAVESDSASDSTYTGMDAQLQACDEAGAPLVAQIQGVLQRAETGEQPVNPCEARRLVKQADQLIQEASQLAGDSTPPASTVCS